MMSPRMPRSRKTGSASRPIIHWPGPARQRWRDPCLQLTDAMAFARRSAANRRLRRNAVRPRPNAERLPRDHPSLRSSNLVQHPETRSSARERRPSATAADGETARLQIALARIVRPQVDETEVICRHPDRRVEAGPALSAHVAYLELDASPGMARRAACSAPLRTDRHHFRFIVTPEDAAEMTDLKAFTRDLVTSSARWRAISEPGWGLAPIGTPTTRMCISRPLASWRVEPH
jgi:hypothetical protein